jgi:hypothetical protein
MTVRTMHVLGTDVQRETVLDALTQPGAQGRYVRARYSQTPPGHREALEGTSSLTVPPCSQSCPARWLKPQSNSLVPSTRLRLCPHHARAPSRRDKASGRAHNPTHPCQRVCCARNQGGCRTGPSADRAGRSAWRSSRGPAPDLLCPLCLLGRELSGIQRRFVSRSFSPFLGAC